MIVAELERELPSLVLTEYAKRIALFEAEGYCPPTIAKMLKSEGIFVSTVDEEWLSFIRNIRNLLICSCWALISKTRESPCKKLRANSSTHEISRYFITRTHAIFRQLFCALIRRITGASTRANYRVRTRITLYARIHAPTYTHAPTAYAAYTLRSREYSLWPAMPRLTM